MDVCTFTLTLAGIPLNFRLLYPEGARYFEGFRQPPRPDCPLVFMTDREIEEERCRYGPETLLPMLEFNELATRASDWLLPFNRCVFHGVSFLWRGKAWIFTAPSGTGKSTQYVLWKHLYGEELSILNGDKPILECSESGPPVVWPSPWRGKERMGRQKAAPLGGIIYLVQGAENHISMMPPARMIVPLFAQFLFTASTPEAVRQVCAMEDRLLRVVPVWQLTNRGDEASARLTYDTIAKWEECNHEA